MGEVSKEEQDKILRRSFMVEAGPLIIVGALFLFFIFFYYPDLAS